MSESIYAQRLRSAKIHLVEGDGKDPITALDRLSSLYADYADSTIEHECGYQFADAIGESIYELGEEIRDALGLNAESLEFLNLLAGI